LAAGTVDWVGTCYLDVNYFRRGLMGEPRLVLKGGLEKEEAMMWMRTYLFMGRAFTMDELRRVNDDFWQMKRVVTERLW
jgi:hypothetical protein